jgi:hypothetical protein
VLELPIRATEFGLPVRTFLYARVSDAAQTIEHRRLHAEAAGFRIDEVIADHGVSGVTTKMAGREGGRRMFDKVKAPDQVVCGAKSNYPSQITHIMEKGWAGLRAVRETLKVGLTSVYRSIPAEWLRPSECGTA